MRAARRARGHGVLFSDYHCGHWVRLDADRWPDHVRLSDVETGFLCTACGRRGADIRPDWKTVDAYA
jgi:hypothetical protein